LKVSGELRVQLKYFRSGRTRHSFNPLPAIIWYQFRWKLQIVKLLTVIYWLGFLLQLCFCKNEGHDHRGKTIEHLTNLLHRCQSTLHLLHNTITVSKYLLSKWSYTHFIRKI